MDIKSIETEAEYKVALTEAESLMSAGPDSPEGERLLQLADLVEAYEDKHFRSGLEPLTLVDALEFVMDQNSLSVEDLEQKLGTECRIREILKGECYATPEMLEHITQKLRLPEGYLAEMAQPQFPAEGQHEKPSQAQVQQRVQPQPERQRKSQAQQSHRPQIQPQVAALSEKS